MASPLSPLQFLHIFFSVSTLLVISIPSPLEPLCPNDESYALLQFKRSFLIKKESSSDPLAYPKVTSWRPERDCCSWNGVECDEGTGHVIGLDLSSSYLHGSINSNSSLFRLVHLQRLNLADNNFSYSQIPSAVHHLSRLRYLNLSRSSFYGQIPLEISELSKLDSLDLSLNIDYYGNSLLQLKRPNLRRLVQNLTSLENLQLSYVDISSVVPDILANFSLRSLSLGNCGMHGTFPTKILQLPNLEFLNLTKNENLSGYLPEFQQRTPPLKTLRLGYTNFSGGLPKSIGNLNSLTVLDIKYCMFSGSVPYSIGNLTKLTYLRLALNNFMGEIPSSLANLTKLTYMSIGFNNFSNGNLAWLGGLTKLTMLFLPSSNLIGEIPSSVSNLTQLQYLSFEHNQFTGQIPSWLSNLTQLNFVSLQYNYLHGPIPESIFQLINLEALYLNFNYYLNGTVKFDMFLNLTNLKILDLSVNQFSVLTKVYGNATLPKYKFLGLNGCNLNRFPDFLQYQNELEFLELDGNNIHGQIPEWIWNISRDSLQYIGLSGNSLTGFVPSVMVSQLKNLHVLHLNGNQLKGSIPIPSSSLIYYSASSNFFSGEISSLICEWHSLEILNLAFNKLSGTLPQCLGNFSDSLQMLNLKNNFIQGTIPRPFSKGNALRMLDLSQNQLEGSLPRSLANCKGLDSLDLSDNHINDKFPFWLGSLPLLQVLGLRSNKFNGAIGSPPTHFEFPMLRIIDLSHNDFEGKLPYGYFNIWNSMKFLELDGQLTYMEFDMHFNLPYYSFSLPFFFSIKMTKSGVNISYSKISTIVVAIDLSSNKFSGEIPESMGGLKMLGSLNLSNNYLTGRIPSSLGNLTSIDSLDLSLNNLRGEIPQQLTQLTSLGFLNVSNNHLSGPIPQGKQFDTFENSSYKGNLGLCGKPLSKKCGNSEASHQVPGSSEEDHGSSSTLDFNWMIISMGYISGLVVGVVIGQTFTTWKHKWFMKASGSWQSRRRRRWH